MKKAITFGSTITVFALSVYFVSCQKTTVTPKPEEEQGEPVLPVVPYDYQTKHKVNSNYATLGRVLFYDQRLSVNDAVSCASCHKQEFAFANNTVTDRGANGQFLTRNSPSIQGLRGFQSFNNSSVSSPNGDNQEKVLLFWDARQNNLADMVLNPVLNHKEMNMPSFAVLTQKLSQIPYYNALFTNAFGDGAVTKERIAFALQSFIACLNTQDFVSPPPVEIALPSTLNEAKSAEEVGRFLFHNKYNCAQCHDQGRTQNINPGTGPTPEPPTSVGPYSTPVEPSIALFNIGLDEIAIDKGLGALTGRPGDNGLFKVPTLQNIAFTAPYMHDGRFATLDQVLEHYSHGIQANANLSPKFKNFDGTPKELNILPAEKNAIIAFLKTLKNDDFLHSPMYSDPFKK